MDTAKLYPIFFFICVVLPLCYAVISVALLSYGYLDQLDYSYNIIRLTSIGINFVVYFITARNLGLYSGRGKLPRDHPLVILTSRLKWYPIVQMITRLWPSIYELTYGNALDHASFSTGNASSDAEIISYGILLPSAGIGFFLVFLAVQPLARAHWSELCCNRKVKEPTDVYDRSSVCSVNPLSENDTFRGSTSDRHPSVTNSNNTFSRLEMDEDELIHEINSEHRSARALSKEPSSGHDIAIVHAI